MSLYLIIIFISMLAVSLLNIFLSLTGVWVSIGMTILIVAMLVSIDAIVATIVRSFPMQNFDPEKKIFKTRKGEKNFYNFIKLAKWKDYIPEAGKLLVKFDKRQIENKKDVQYLYKFLTEMGYAEIMHLISAFLGYLVIVMLPFSFTVTFVLPLASVNLILQFLPYFVQRYNRPRLYKVYLYTLKKQDCKNKNHSSLNEDIAA